MRPITVSRTVRAPSERVWEVLSDGWRYPVWVVGAARIRAVDVNWPDVGARLHHSVGAWPLLLDDVTRVLESEPDRRLVLDAQAWPFGSARVEIEVEPCGPAASVVRIREEVSGGPGRLFPRITNQPGIALRNREVLRRFAYLCEDDRPEPDV